jgi:hypothetical protein
MGAGRFSHESGFDILVVMKKRPFSVIDRINEVFLEFENRTGIPFSVVVKEAESFEKGKKYKTSFYRTVKKEGVVLHGKA